MSRVKWKSLPVKGHAERDLKSWDLVIYGNQEDPKEGNPIPYYRMTQKSKWKDKYAKRYNAWKKYVQQCWLEKFGKYPDFEPTGTYQLNVFCHFMAYGPDVHDGHGDPDNIRKGIQDALFESDCHIWGTVYFTHDTIPGVSIEVKE